MYVRADMDGLGPDLSARARQDSLWRDSIVYLTCVHELGHALGLSHTADFRDVMYFFGYGGDIIEVLRAIPAADSFARGHRPSVRALRRRHRQTATVPPMKTIVGILVIAAVATLGDFTWYTFGIQHTLVAGLVHGALLLTAVGAVLGAASGHVVKGLPIGTLAGLIGAASYYVLVAVMDSRTSGSAIPSAWVIMWLTLAGLDGRWLRAPARRTWGDVARRGIAAATVGGLAFYLVLNTLWGRPPCRRPQLRRAVRRVGVRLGSGAAGADPWQR